jgi:hypothetical protein
MRRCFSVMLLAGALAASGCDVQTMFPFADSGAVVRLYLVNTSASKFVSPNPGICPQGIEESTTHQFLDKPPVIAPGTAVSYTTWQIAGFGGLCADADPSFSVGLCGWKFGDSADMLELQPEKFGGQIGFQFNCGDTVILRWSDSGPACGTWTSEVLTAPGNALPSMPFMTIGGGACTAF